MELFLLGLLDLLPWLGLLDLLPWLGLPFLHLHQLCHQGLEQRYRILQSKTIIESFLT